MRSADLLRLALSALWRHKVRTLLTLSGVVAGTFLLVVSIAISRGVEEATIRQLRKNDQLRTITVFPSYQPLEDVIPPSDLIVNGPMSDAKRQRLRRSLVRHWPRRSIGGAPTRPLDEKALDLFRELEHVESAWPTLQLLCRVSYDGKSADVLTTAHVSEEDRLGDRIVAPEPTPRPALPEYGRSVLIHEYVLYQWGLTSDEDAARMIGQKVRVEMRSRGVVPPPMGLMPSATTPLTPTERDALDRALMGLAMGIDQLKLGEAEKAVLRKVLAASGMAPGQPMETVVFAEDFTIAGVVREWEERDKAPAFFVRDWLLRDAELFLPARTASEMVVRDPRHHRYGYGQATVTVRNEDHLKEVSDHITALGFRCYSLAELYERVRKNILLVSIAAAFLAAMALVVASVGITNMMLMSVMERTHEIGLMKAVGARDRNILFLFLSEGVVLGVVGGLLGLLFGWLVSFPGDHIARSIVEKELQAKLDHSVFVYPFWVVTGVPLFALVVTTLSALLPSRRAARIDPIQALRAE